MNKPGCEVDDLKGGVAGGSILCGVLKVFIFKIVPIIRMYIIFTDQGENWCNTRCTPNVLKKKYFII